MREYLIYVVYIYINKNVIGIVFKYVYCPEWSVHYWYLKYASIFFCYKVKT